MKKVILIIVSILTISHIVGNIQTDKVNATVCGINGNEIEFELPNGHIYAWIEENGKSYVIGETRELVMFDCEDMDATNDVIVKVK